MRIASLFEAFKLSASGLTAQRARLNVISANIANAEVTRTPEGGPYKRQIVTLESTTGTNSSTFSNLMQTDDNMGGDFATLATLHSSVPEGSVTFQVGADTTTKGRLEFEPGHPDANAEGFVEYPNVDMVNEMVDLLSATRAYEANVTVMNSTKAMLKKALEI